MRIAVYIFAICVACVCMVPLFGPYSILPFGLLFAGSIVFEKMWLRYGVLAYVALFQIPFWLALFALVQLPPEGVSSWSFGSPMRPSRTYIFNSEYTVHGRQLVFEQLLIGSVIYLMGDVFRLWLRKT